MTILRKHGILLLAAAMVLIGLGAFALSRGEQTSPSGNLAVVDKDLTSQVQTSVAATLVGVLSYDFADPGRSEQVADDKLAGEARKEYDTLVASLHEKAAGQELVLSAQVTASAVKELSSSEAELLVFLDQTSKRAADDEASVSAAQLSITAELVRGDWVVTGLAPL
ncbi:MAG TPA: hypothetical protein VIR30_05345 [Nocardioides sp.]